MKGFKIRCRLSSLGMVVVSGSVTRNGWSVEVPQEVETKTSMLIRTETVVYFFRVSPGRRHQSLHTDVSVSWVFLFKDPS